MCLFSEGLQLTELLSFLVPAGNREWLLAKQSPPHTHTYVHVCVCVCVCVCV